MRKGDWIQTFTGRAFWPLDPAAEEIDIIDIAHALSLTCRFGGHCKEFYSVAEHSILVSELCRIYYGDYQSQLWGLLHDAAEAYILDMPRPLKHLLPDYIKMERAIDEVIIEKFNIKYDEVKQKVKDVDKSMLFLESKELMSTPPIEWSDCSWTLGYRSEDFRIRYFSPEQAEKCFLQKFNDLWGLNCDKTI